MINEIKIYRCTDGTRFDSFNKAVEYENLCKKCKEIDNILLPFNTKIVHHDIKKVNEYFNKMLGLFIEVISLYKDDFEEYKKDKSLSIRIRNILFDWNKLCLVNLFRRYERIDKNGVEQKCYEAFDYKE